jgi:hypothetical protein
MSPDAFIERAIDAGSRDGVAAISADQRFVFLISEAEVLCDMEGIDTFLNQYGRDWLPESADAFEAVGATEIAAGLRSIGADTPRDDPILDRVNHLIGRRAGYDYEAIRREVESRLASTTQTTDGYAEPESSNDVV